MSSATIALVLLAAVLHALWNSIIKASSDGLIVTWAVVAAAAIANVPLLLILGPPGRDVWWLLAISTAIHVAYNVTLVAAYERADLSVAYPIARGTAPLLVTLAGATVLGDSTTAQGVVGVVLVSLSLATVVSGQPMRNTAMAGLTGLMIASYTVVDGAGVRANGDSVQYIAAVFVLHALIFTGIVVHRRGIDTMRRTAGAQPFRLLLGGTASAAAYLLVMIAARTEPLGLVAGLRETSAFFGLAIGAWVLDEHVTTRQTVAVVIAVVGTIAIATS